MENEIYLRKLLSSRTRIRLCQVTAPLSILACSIATKLQTLSKLQVFLILENEARITMLFDEGTKKKGPTEDDTSNDSKTSNTNPLIRGMTPATRAKQPTRIHLCQ